MKPTKSSESGATLLGLSKSHSYFTIEPWGFEAVAVKKASSLISISESQTNSTEGWDIIEIVKFVDYLTLVYAKSINQQSFLQ